MRDLHHNMKSTPVLAPVLIDSDTTTAGEVIDTQGFESLEFVLQSGELADGTFTGAMAEADAVDGGGDLVSGTTVVAADLLGSLPALTASGTAGRVGYRGRKRYVRFDVVSTLTTDGGLLAVLAVQANARNNPVA